MTTAAQQYMQDVTTGKVPACVHVINSVKRFEADLQNGHKRGLFYNPAAGELFLHWAKVTLRFTKGSQAGKPVIFEPWQQFHYCQLFGWRTGNINGPRRFKISYLEIPRKNGKTPMAAAVTLYMAFFDGEARAQVFAAATKKDQARICFNDAAEFVRQSPILSKYIYADNLRIAFKNAPPQFAGNFITPLSADANTLDGLDVHCAVVDELHAHPNANVYDVLKTAIGARQQPLIYSITTAGYNKESICYELSQYTEAVLNGDVLDDRFLGVRYTVDAEDKPLTNPACWIKANPNINVSKYQNYIEAEVKEATNRPTYTNTVLKYDFNLWLDVYTQWVPVDAWRKLKAPKQHHELEGVPCIGGLDLANTTDFTAFALLFDFGATLYVKMFYWLPQAKYDTHRQKLPHDAKRWVRDGWLSITPGNVLDDRTISAEITTICTQYNVQAISYDRAKAHTGVVQDLAANLGADFCQPQGQNIGAMGAPTSELRQHIEGGKIAHDGNPITTWQLGNVVVWLDANNNEKLVKDKSKGKIDGVVAMVNAMAQHMVARANPGNYYDENDLTVVTLNK